MAKISTITFNGSNAYELSTGEFATSWPYGAVGFEQASAGVQLYSATAGSGAILRIRAIGANGLLISEQNQTHMLTVLNLWERAEKAYTIPAGTVKLELRIVAVGGTVLFAQPKLANGASVGAYATNFAPQLTMITPTGIYTGTITAEQIVLTGGERLPDRLLTLNASLISLRSGLNGVDGKIAELKSESLTFTNTINGKTSKMDADGIYLHTVKASQVQTGLLKSTNNNSWINLDNGIFSFGNGALAWNGSQLNVTGKFSTTAGGANPAKVEIDRGVLSVYSSSGAQLGMLTNVGQYTAGSGDGLSIMGGSSSQYLDIGFWAAGIGGSNYIRLNNAGSGSPPIMFNTEVQMSSYLKVSIIKNKQTNQNAFYTDGTSTWISSPNGQSHLFIGNSTIQLIRNGTVLQQW